MDFRAVKEEVAVRKDLQIAIERALKSGEAVSTGRGSSGVMSHQHACELEL